MKIPEPEKKSGWILNANSRKVCRRSITKISGGFTGDYLDENMRGIHGQVCEKS